MGQIFSTIVWVKAKGRLVDLTGSSMPIRVPSVVCGVQVPEMEYLVAIARLRDALCDELLPYHEVKEVLSALRGRLDGGLEKRLEVSLCAAAAAALGRRMEGSCMSSGVHPGLVHDGDRRLL